MLGKSVEKRAIDAQSLCHDSATSRPPSVRVAPSFFDSATANMDLNGRPAVQVVINGHPQAQQAYGASMSFQSQHKPQYRPLSVDEALQYSSMSSAPVFGLGPSICDFPTRTPRLDVD